MRKNKKENTSNTAETLEQKHCAAIDILQKTHNTMVELAAMRLEQKLSGARVSGVARELAELIKVMSVYATEM